MEKCSYCISFKPTWEKLKTEFNGKPITFLEYENSKNSEIMEKENIEYYPTIKIKSLTNDYEYSGNRSFDDLSNKIETAINDSKNIVAGSLEKNKSLRSLKRKYMKYKLKYINEKKKKSNI